MATHKSAEKRARQSLKKTKRNAETLGAVRTFEKKVRAALAANDVAKAQELLKAFSSKIDKAAKKGIVHMKNASRKVGRLSAHLHKLTQKGA